MYIDQTYNKGHVTTYITFFSTNFVNDFKNNKFSGLGIPKPSNKVVSSPSLSVIVSDTDLPMSRPFSCLTSHGVPITIRKNVY